MVSFSGTFGGGKGLFEWVGNEARAGGVCHLSLPCKVCSPVPKLVGVLLISLLQLVVLLLGQHHLLLILEEGGEEERNRGGEKKGGASLRGNLL